MPKAAIDTNREWSSPIPQPKRFHGETRNPDSKPVPTTTLMVRNLYCVDFDEDDLESFISELAIESGFSLPSNVTIPLDKRTGKFKGFAFIEFPHVDAAQQFIKTTKGVLRIRDGRFPVSFSNKSDDAKTNSCLDWSCLRCDFMNFAHRNLCKRCGFQRIAGTGIPSESIDDLSTRIDVKVARVLELCPGLIPDGSRYYTDDPDRLWLFDPQTLYWFKKDSSCYYRQPQDNETVLRKVDRRGHFVVGSKDVALPARTIPVRGGFVHAENTMPQEDHQEQRNGAEESPPIHFEESLGRVSFVNAVESTVCSICARMFESVAALRRHENLSDLHKRNLARNNN